MSALDNLVIEYLSSKAAVYFAKQLAVILCIFIFGSILVDVIDKDSISRIKKAALAFPAGLGAFLVTAYAMLVIGIPYNMFTVVSAVVIETIAAIVLGRRSFAAHIEKDVIIRMLITLAVAVAAGAVATSGLAPVSISNDSMYFFRRYPDIIVYYQKLRDQFDFWLTDTGLGAVAIDTLPSLFGFGETFGIREFFHIDFVFFFSMCVHERAAKYMKGRKPIIACIVVTCVLMISTPFVILGHWALANMYFMELFFMAAYSALSRDDDRMGSTYLLLVALSLLRIEGTIFVVWLILCISLYKNVASKLASRTLLPMMVLFGGYCIRIFCDFYVLDNIYLFLTPQKAVMLVLLMIAAFFYLMFIEAFMKKRAGRLLPLVYIGAFILGNMGLLVINTPLYIGNLRAFNANLFRQSGWGMFPYFAIAVVVLIVVEYLIRRKTGERGYEGSFANGFDVTLTVGFALIVIAASYGRGDVLAEEVGDSGNRVLLQITPLVIMTLCDPLLKIAGSSDR